jgi:hypothetical protein
LLGSRLGDVDCALNAELLPAALCRQLVSTFSAPALATADQALKLARRLVGSFRSADLADPDIFATTLSSVFARFPFDDGVAVIDPIDGLPAKSPFCPTLSEVVEALQAQAARRAQIVRNAEWMEAERIRRAEQPAVIPESRRQELVAWARGKANEIVSRMAEDVTVVERPPSPFTQTMQAAWDKQADASRLKTWAGNPNTGGVIDDDAA